MAASSPPAATGSSPGAAEPGTPWLSETLRREQGSESHPFWSTSTTPEAKLPWECCPQPPPWCGVTVRRHPCTCLPSGLPQPPAVPIPSQAQRAPWSSVPPASCCSLLWGVPSNPGTGCAGAPCPSVPLPLTRTVGGAAGMNYISAKEDVFPSERVALEGGAVVQVCGNDF